MSRTLGAQAKHQDLWMNWPEFLGYVGRLVVLGLLIVPPVRRWFFLQNLSGLYLVVFTFLVAFLIVPLVQSIALRYGVVDLPAARKVHHFPTPLLGGVAVYFAFAIGVLYNFHFSLALKGVVLGGTLVLVVGVLDDIFNLRASLKLAGHITGALIAVSYGVTLNLAPASFPFAPLANGLLTLLWFAAITNAVQFLDGMDGLAAGLGVFSSFFFGIVAAQTDQFHLMYLSAALLGASFGFLPYNFRPNSSAGIFLGDGGSSFIGFTLAGLAVMGEWADRDPLVALATPLLILAVPVFDICYVSVNRVITGKVHSFHEWLAYVGRDHIHHRFQALGLSKSQTVLLIHFLSVTLGISALLLKGAHLYEALLLIIQATSVFFIIAILETAGRHPPSNGH